MADPPETTVPRLAPGDVYVFSHGNGAVFVLPSDGRSRLAPLDEALEVVAGCHAAGHRVVLGWDETPIARGVVERIAARGIPVEVFEPTRPPHRWNEGTDALMEAAKVGSDAILDDLLARGADVDRTDDSGSTALHHAAAWGNLHAVEALVAAGATVDLVNRRGFTPHMVAMSTGEREVARRLAELGADPEGVRQERAFGVFQHGTMWAWPICLLAFFATLTGALWPIGWIDLAVLALLVALYVRLSPPRAFWTGGVARRLDGTRLTIRGVAGRLRTVDLAGVDAAAIGGIRTRSGAHGARWLLLGHPDGHPVDARVIRRLNVPTGEVEGVARSIERAVVVPVAGPGDDVVVAVGNVLSGRGVPMSTTLRHQLAAARKDRDRPRAKGRRRP